MKSGNQNLKAKVAFVFVWTAIASICLNRLPNVFASTLTYKTQSDFAQGTFAGNGIDAAADGSLQLSFAASDVAPELHSLTGLETPRRNHGVVFTHGRFYVSGGIDSNGSKLNSVISAQLLNDGTISAWRQESSLPLPLAFSTMGEGYGRLYIIGGADASNKAQSSVYSALINPDGSLGPWRSENPLPSARWRHAMTIMDGRIYVSGGHDAFTIPQSTVFSAPIQSDGSLGPWITEPNALPSIRYYHKMCGIGDRLYVIGGMDGSSPQNSVFSAQIINHNLGSWIKETENLPLAIYGHEAQVLNGTIFVSGGFNSSNQSISSIYSSAINLNGTLGKWTGNAYSLPSQRAFHSEAVANDKIYSFGGTDQFGTVFNSVFFLGMDDQTTFGPWKSNVTSLPYSVSGSANAVWNGRLYVMGGADPINGYSTKVFSAPINSDGTVGSWKLESDLPEQRVGATACAINNRIFLIGGETDSGAALVNLSAPIMPDGSLGTWRQELPFPSYLATAPWNPGLKIMVYGRSDHAMAFWDNRIYVSGGHDGSGSGMNLVYSALVSSDGSLSSWRNEAPLPKGMNIHGMIASGNRLYTVPSYGDSVYSCAINLDGSLGSWTISGPPLPSPAYYLRTLATENKIYVFGQGSGKNVNYSASILSDASVGPWTMEPDLLPGPANASNVFSWKGKHYVVGGDNSSAVYFTGTPHYASKGAYISDIIDLGSPRLIDSIFWNEGAKPSGSGVNLFMKAGVAGGSPLSQFVSVTNHQSLNSFARYIQFKVEMTPGGSSSYPNSQTPTFSTLSISHLPDILSAVYSPLMLAQTAVNTSSISIQFMDRSLGEDAFLISTASASGASNDSFRLSSMLNSSGSVMAADLANLAPNTAYFIRVRGFNSQENAYGVFSNEISTVTLAALPQLNLPQVQQTSIIASWDNCGNPSDTLYLVDFATSSSFIGAVTSTRTYSLSVTSQSLTPNTQLSIRVCAVNRNNLRTVFASTQTVMPFSLGLKVVVTTSSYILSWEPRHDILGYRVKDETGNLISTLQSDSAGFMEDHLLENQKIVRQVESFDATSSSAIIHVSFFTLLSAPGNAQKVLRVLDKSMTSIKLQVNPPPQPQLKSGVRVRISDSQNTKTVNFTDAQWEQEIAGLVNGTKYSLVPSYVNSDGVESSPAKESLDVVLGFGSGEVGIKAEKEKFFINDGVNFVATSNQSGLGTLNIYGIEQNLVRSIPFVYGPGQTAVRWDGRDSFGNLVYTDIYWAVIKNGEFGDQKTYVAAIR